MARERKNGVRVTAILDSPVHNRLVQYAEIKGQTKTMAIERLLNYALNHAEEIEQDNINKLK